MEETFHLFKTKQKSGCPSSKVAKNKQKMPKSQKYQIKYFKSCQNKQKVPKSHKYHISSILCNECNGCNLLIYLFRGWLVGMGCVVVGGNMRISIRGSNPNGATRASTSPRSYSLVLHFIISEVCIIGCILKFNPSLLVC